MGYSVSFFGCFLLIPLESVLGFGSSSISSGSGSLCQVSLRLSSSSVLVKAAYSTGKVFSVSFMLWMVNKLCLFFISCTVVLKLYLNGMVLILFLASLFTSPNFSCFIFKFFWLIALILTSSSSNFFWNASYSALIASILDLIACCSALIASILAFLTIRFSYATFAFSSFADSVITLQNFLVSSSMVYSSSRWIFPRNSSISYQTLYAASSFSFRIIYYIYFSSSHGLEALLERVWISSGTCQALSSTCSGSVRRIISSMSF